MPHSSASEDQQALAALAAVFPIATAFLLLYLYAKFVFKLELKIRGRRNDSSTL
jgi:hypothetical protein